MNTINREQIITNMCYTWRYDYGIHKEEGAEGQVSGMSPNERITLWNNMAKVFDECIDGLYKIPDSRNLCDND
jgi:hypothetical protein